MSDQDHKAHHETTFSSGQITTTLRDDDDMVRDLHFVIRIDAKTRTMMVSVEVKCNDKLGRILDQIRVRNSRNFSNVDDFDIVVHQNENDTVALKRSTIVSNDMGTEEKPLYIVIDKVDIQSQGTICIFASAHREIFVLLTFQSILNWYFFHLQQRCSELRSNWYCRT
jgi:hypothetical protein